MARTFRQFLAHAIGGVNHNGKRDYNDIYGYPDSLAGTEGFEKMWQLCRRTGIANRLTAGMSRLCWRNGFEIYENEEKNANRILTDEYSALKKTNLLNYIERVDTLNRIGRFSVLLIGVPDGRELIEEIGRVRSGDKMLSSVWYRPFAYDSVVINKWDKDPKSRRYGMPLEYTLSVNNKDGEKESVANSVVAHWSRVVHLNEGALESDVEGMGYIEPITNVLYNLEKTLGASSEIYFRNAKGKVVFELDKEFAPFFEENEEAKNKHESKTEDFINNFRDQISISGGKAYSIDTPMYTPKDTIMGNLWIVSGYSGWPIRVLTGEGSGQLAGSEDRLAMNSIIGDRQNSFCSSVVVEILERLRLSGMVDTPETYDIRLPLQQETTVDQEVENNKKRAETFKQVAETLRGLDGLLNADSVFRHFGFEEIETNDAEFLTEDDEIDEIDENDDEPEPNTND